MTPARQQALVRGLTTVARKVFDATPINEPWSASQIDAELRRIGTPKSIHMVTGCLNGLVKDGLVTEGPLRMFQRIVPRSYEPPTPLDLNSILKHAAVPHKEPAVASTLPRKLPLSGTSVPSTDCRRFPIKPARWRRRSRRLPMISTKLRC